MARTRLPRQTRFLATRGMEQPLIQSPILTQKLQAALGVHGKSAAPQLGDLVHPVVILEDISRDNWYSGHIDRAVLAGGVFTAAAATFPVMQLFNPAGSSVVAIIDSIYLASGPTAEFQLLQTTTPLPAAFGLPAFCDTRLNGNPTVVVNFDQPAAIPGFNLIGVGRCTTTSTQRVDPGYILRPGNGLNVAINALASTIEYTFNWRERFA